MSSPRFQTAGDPGNNPIPPNQKGPQVGVPGDDPKDSPAKPVKKR